MTREQLIEAYVEHIIDGMDHKDLWQVVYETLTERLEDYTQVDLENEIADNAPHLLGE
jgi:hypothetical protein